MVFQNVRNLCAISGDAVQISPKYFQNCIFSNIFVNHPEPPVQYGGFSRREQSEKRGDDMYGKHLLTTVKRIVNYNTFNARCSLFSKKWIGY